MLVGKKFVDQSSEYVFIITHQNGDEVWWKNELSSGKCSWSFLLSCGYRLIENKHEKLMEKLCS